MSDLFQNHAAKFGPVECLGQTFPSDEARREHYLKLLAEKLKDPEFRKIEGFPIGSDEDILALSDPPYYMACPNPFIEDFVRHYGKPYDSSVPYSKEPFAADVSEGKNDPIYNAHSYHTKVPFKAVMRYILHYTQPGDIVFDGFCGTGMAGIASQMCGSRDVVSSLGYQVLPDGTILQEELDESGNKSWKPFSKIGTRRAILNDLSPAATFLAFNFNAPVDVIQFDDEARKILSAVEHECGWMYETKHTDGRIGRIVYAIWSDVYICQNCAGEVVYWNSAIDTKEGEVRDKFNCPHCGADLTKDISERAWETKIDHSLHMPIKQAKQIPVLLIYTVPGIKGRFEKEPDAYDLELIDKIDKLDINSWHPVAELPDGVNTRQPIRSHGMTHVHHFYTKRNLAALASFYRHAKSSRSRFLFTAFLGGATKLNQFHLKNYVFGGGGFNPGPRKGTLYAPSISMEVPITSLCSDRIATQVRGYQQFVGQQSGNVAISTGSCGNFGHVTTNEILDYIFIDPPFGANLNYSELSFTWESWLRVSTDSEPEAIENTVQKKGATEYRKLMSKCFSEAYRLLKPGRWMTVEFSNTKASVWNNIQAALSEAGFIVANVSALDKKQGGINANISKTAVKQDLVISAYKPNGSFEKRFANEASTEDGLWDFVRTHLGYLPTVKLRYGQLDFVSERDPRIIFDRMVAWYVRHSLSVPLSTQEFQAGLLQRFVERDGMIFLPDQVTEYDRKRMQVAVAPQMEMFVSDERSAIDWLTDFLKRRPSTYQEVHTDFISQLGAGWKKHESKPELAALLEDNFIQYDGSGEVPSQIHSYLSTNYKDLRGLEKNSPALVAKANDRWYVPDPNKAQDLEKKREKALLKEFDHYRAFTGRRLKEFRLEALRAGFRFAWGNKDYQTIIDIAKKVPDEALQEDEKLLTLYDLALTRTEDGI
jgi:DNA modification methylase